VYTSIYNRQGRVLKSDKNILKRYYIKFRDERDFSKISEPKKGSRVWCIKGAKCRIFLSVKQDTSKFVRFV